MPTKPPTFMVLAEKLRTSAFWVALERDPRTDAEICANEIEALCKEHEAYWGDSPVWEDIGKDILGKAHRRKP